jgi:histidine triad (HIT) family protein
MSIFTKIISGEIGAYKVREDERFLAFLDIAPLREGHVLVIPKVEVNNLFDLSPEYLSGFLLFAQPVAKAIERSFRCNRCGITVIGLEVPHAHMHLIPINSSNDLNFTQPKLKVTPAQLESTQQRILQHLKEQL